MNNRRADLFTVLAYVLSFLIILAGVLLPVLFINSKQNSILSNTERLKLKSDLPYNLETSVDESLVFPSDDDNYHDFLSRLELWEMNHDKSERSPYSYEMDLSEVYKTCMAHIRQFNALGLITDPEPESFVIATYKISSNYINISGGEVSEKYKTVLVDGVSLPYDLGRWDVTLRSNSGRLVNFELDALTGRIYSFALIFPSSDSITPSGTALALFAKMNGILEQTNSVSYDPINQFLYCKEIVLSYTEQSDGDMNKVILNSKTLDSFTDGNPE